MKRSNRPLAGGFPLIVAILVGAVWGLVAGNPMQGALAGTLVGIAAATAVWLLDRRCEP